MSESEKDKLIESQAKTIEDLSRKLSAAELEHFLLEHEISLLTCSLN